MAEIVHSSSGYKYTNTGSTPITAGTVVVNSKLFGIASATIAAGATGWIETKGVWEIECGNTETSNIGDVAYWNASTSKITATKGTNLPVGYFTTKIASGTTSCPILLGANLQASEASAT